MLTTNANFDAKHDLDYKTPLYLIHFDREDVDYCNHEPTSPDNALKQYLVSIDGISSKVFPEEGKSSIGALKLKLLDVDDEITAMLATDTYYFHRRKTTVKAGYLGMAETDLLTVMVGWVTALALTDDGLVYEFEVTDPQKWLQRNIFRGSEDTPVTFQGNPINLLLAILTSTGDGDNGDYDWFAETDGLGIDTDYINVSQIEDVRDNWFPGDSNYMHFTVSERQKARDWLANEIFKPLNIYPYVDGRGRYGIRPFKPPIAGTDEVQSFDEDNVIGLPSWDANLDAMINEIEWHYDWDADDGEFDNTSYYVDADSVNNRGAGKKPLVIKSKGLHCTTWQAHGDRATDVITRRKTAIFNRYAAPPTKIMLRCFFSRWLSEAGDIVPFSHPLLPDIVSGVRGLTDEYMEVVSRTVNWRKGIVNIELLATGFAQNRYAVVSPAMTVVTGTSGTEFSVSAADAAKFSVGWEAAVWDQAMRPKTSPVTILTIDTDTGDITCDDIGETPSAGWVVTFADYDDCTTEQQRYGFIAETKEYPSDPIGVWKFDEGSGTEAVDDTGNGNDGTLEGTMTDADWVQVPTIGSMLDLDGTDDRVDCGNALGDNLITATNDRDFSGGTIGNWGLNTDGSGTLVYDAGEGAGKLTAAGDELYLNAYITAARLDETPADGDEYFLVARIKVPAANTNKTVRVFFYDGAVNQKSVTLAGDTWTYVTYHFTPDSDVVTSVQAGFTTGGDCAAGDILYFDNIAVYKASNGLAAIGASDFSVSFWMKSGDTISSWDKLFAKYQNIDNRIEIGAYNGTNCLFAHVESAAGDKVTPGLNFSDIAPFDEALHHIVVVFSYTDGKVYAYCDGTKSSIERTLATGDWSNTGNVAWGGYSDGSSPYLGKLADCRIYDKTLTQAEVDWLYAHPAVDAEGDYLGTSDEAHLVIP